MFVNPMAAARTIGTDISAGRYLRKNSGRSRFVAVVMTDDEQTDDERNGESDEGVFPRKALVPHELPPNVAHFLVFVAVVFAIYSVNHGIWVA